MIICNASYLYPRCFMDGIFDHMYQSSKHYKNMANVGKYTKYMGILCIFFKVFLPPPGNGGDCLGCHCFSCWSCDRLGDGHYMSLPLEKMANGVAGG